MNIEEKYIYQRECFAIKACHMMNKTVKEAAELLGIEEERIKLIYRFIEKDMIDFDSI